MIFALFPPKFWISIVLKEFSHKFFFFKFAQETNKNSFVGVFGSVV